jgi:pyrroloquinoline-quinone synthase
MTDPKSYRYFKVHIDADKEHSAVERDLLTAQLDDANGPSAARSTDRVLDALWQMLSGVCSRHGIAC